MIATPRKKRVLKRFNLSSRIRFCIVTDGMVCSSSDVWWCCDGSNDVLVFSDNAVGVIKSVVYCYYQRLCDVDVCRVSRLSGECTELAEVEVVRIANVHTATGRVFAGHNNQ